MPRELIAIFAHALAASLEVPIAVLYDPKDGYIIGWMQDTRKHEFDAKTAIVNVQKAFAEGGRDLSNFEIFSTEAPTVMCIGMCALTGIGHVICLTRDAELVQFTPGNNLRDARSQPLSESRELNEIAPGTADWVSAELRYLKDRRVRFLPGVCSDCTVPNLGAHWLRLSNMRWLIHGYVAPRPPAPAYPLSLPNTAAVDAYWLSVARNLATQIHRRSNHHVNVVATGHNIGCVLVSQRGRALAWGVNTNVGNATRHAETNCVWMFQQLYPGQKLPEGATLYTSLQSCLMCAGMIKHTAANNNVRVVYADKDRVQHSALTLGGGAREEPCRLSRGQQHRDAQLHTLARARWDRVRRTVLESKPFSRERFLELFNCNRDEIEQHLSTRDSIITRRAKPLTESVIADLRRERNFKQIPTACSEIRLKIAEEVDQELRLYKDLREDLLELERHGMRKVGQGAPILLRNPCAIERLESFMERIPRDPTATSMQQTYCDLGTINHGLCLTLQVQKLSQSYRSQGH